MFFLAAEDGVEGSDLLLALGDQNLGHASFSGSRDRAVLSPSR
jgi:hypothetical protein